AKTGTAVSSAGIGGFVRDKEAFRRRSGLGGRREAGPRHLLHGHHRHLAGARFSKNVFAAVLFGARHVFLFFPCLFPCKRLLPQNQKYGVFLLPKPTFENPKKTYALCSVGYNNTRGLCPRPWILL
ncbi:unnamed protein product, partial [Ectocarpus sp. 8 AP-2014]